MLYRIIGALLLGLATLLAANAQTDSMTVELPEIIISENRLQLPYAEQTRSIVIQSAEDIKMAPVISVSEALHYVAGVDVRSRGANGVQSDIGIRGGTFDQTLVLLNGVKISDMQTGHHSLNLPVDLSNVERIEVLKGPAARIYGQNAFSGAVNIVTKTPVETGAEVQITGGDFSLWGGKIAGSLSNERNQHYLSATYDRSEGYKYNTDYQILNGFYQGGWDVGNGRIDFMAGVTNRKFGANGFYASPEFTDQYEEITTGLGTLSFTSWIKDNAQIVSRLYYRHNTDDYFFIRSDPEFYHNTHKTNTVGVEVNTSIPWKIGLTGIGIDLNQVYMQSNNLGERDRFVSTLFIEHRFEFARKRGSITPGVQLNNYSDFGFFALPGVDIGYDITDDFAVFGSLGKTYRVPTFTDLYYSDPVNLGNPDLQPEFAWTYEAGVKTTRLPGMIVQASYFYRDGSDIIDWVRESDTVPWQPVNVANVIMSGFDSNFSFLVGKMANNEKLVINRFDLNYTYINSEARVSEDLLSRYALENLRHQLGTSLHLRYSRNISHTIALRYYDRVNLDDYFLLDTRLSYDNGKLGVFVDVTNILNKEYMETNLVTMPGRWAKAGVRYSF